MFRPASYHTPTSPEYPLLALMRLNKPVGILLLLWPTWMAVWIAGNGAPQWKWVGIFTLGVILMRSAGCIVNDLADRKFDAFVTRTQHRPLVTGALTPRQAKIALACLITAAFILVCATNILTVALSLVALLLACTYPYAKRYTHFPQVILGAAFGAGIPMAFTAQGYPLSSVCWSLFAANLCWVLAYDTLYAMADKPEDIKIGVKSTAIFFSRYDKLAVFLAHLLALGGFFWCGQKLNLGKIYTLSLGLAFVYIMAEQWLIRTRSPQACLRAFLNNQWLGALFFLGLFYSF